MVGWRYGRGGGVETFGIDFVHGKVRRAIRKLAFGHMSDFNILIQKVWKRVCVFLDGLGTETPGVSLAT